MTTATVSQSSNNTWKIVAVTLVLGVLAFLASPGAPLGFIWGTPPAGAQPTGPQIGLLMLMGAFQALAFGLGIAFLIFGYPLVKNALPDKQGLALAAYLSIGWSLANWWPHSNFHQTLPAGNFNGLLAIEYGFHATSIAAGLVIAYFFVSILRARR